MSEKEKDRELPKEAVAVALLQQHDSTETSTQSFTPHKHPNLAKRIGYISILLLLIAYLTIIAAFAFITWLWWGDHGNSVWRSVVLNSWVTRAVTLAALAVRTAFATQGAICTSMLAALALRWNLVALPDAASVSLIRYTNSGPMSLLLPQLGMRRRGLKLCLTGILVLGLFTTTLLVSITSTALLSDLQLRTLPSFNTSTTAWYAQNMSEPTGREAWIKSNSRVQSSFRPTVFPSFAETQLQPPINVSGVFDTGVQLRALFPIESAEVRSQLSYYSGAATMVAMRTICAQEDFGKLSGRFSLEIDKETQDLLDMEDESYTKTTGFGNEDQQGICFIDPYQNKTNQKEWHVTSCTLSVGYVPDRLNKTNPLLFGELKHNFQQQPPIFYQRYMLFNATNKTNLNFPLPAEWTYGEMDNKYKKSNPDLVTTNYTTSFCTTFSSTFFGTVSASRPGNITELTPIFQTASKSWNISHIIKQLGATKTPSMYSAFERGIFNLDDYWNITHNPDFKKNTALNLPNPAIDITTTCKLYIGQNDHITTGLLKTAFDAVLVALATTSFKETQRAGWAFHTIMWVVFTMTYLEDAPFFNLNGGDATLVTFVERLVPVPGWGYWLGTVMVILHMIFVTLVILLFVAFGGAASLLGQA